MEHLFMTWRELAARIAKMREARQEDVVQLTVLAKDDDVVLIQISGVIASSAFPSKSSPIP
jgi:hypothetical protein